MMVALTLFGSFLLLLLLDAPVALALGAASLLTISLFSLVPLALLPQLLFATADSFTLLAIPFFVFAGIILGHTSISRRLIDLADSLLGTMTGGLAIVGIIASLFFAGMSGSGPAGVAAIGLVLIPAMKSAGYDDDFSAVLCAASGGIGIIIPPSIALIIYGFIAEVSISKLFLAAIVPGMLIACALIAVSFLISLKRGYRGNVTARKRYTPFVAFRRAFWGLMAPVIILGGIYGGVFTPTEAAAIAVLYSIVVDVFIYQSLKPGEVIRIAAEAGVTSAVIMSIVVTASLFAWILNSQGIAAETAERITSLSKNTWMLLLLINAIIFLAGLFLDAISIFYLFLPILLPVIRAIGVDPVHFGIIITVNLAIGQVTPPVGINLIAASGVSGVSMSRIAGAAFPFVLGECIALIIITYLPELSLFMPSLIK